MGGINRIPRGYLNMLGSQTNGKNPFDAAEVVNPVVDMTPFYHADRLSTEFVSGTPAALPFQLTLPVPADESWFVYAAGFAQTVGNVTDTAIISVSLRRLPNTGTNTAFAPIWSPPEMFGTALGGGTQQMKAAIVFPVPIPLQGGSELICFVDDVAAFRFCTFSFVIARLSG